LRFIQNSLSCLSFQQEKALAKFCMGLKRLAGEQMMESEVSHLELAS